MSIKHAKLSTSLICDTCGAFVSVRGHLDATTMRDAERRGGWVFSICADADTCPLHSVQGRKGDNGQA